MKFELRTWCDADLESLVRHADNPRIQRFLTDMFPNPYSREDGIRYLAMVRNETPVRTFAIEVNGEAVGSIGLTPRIDIYRKNMEIGYWLSEEYWGHGIMTGAIRQVVDYGFRTFDVTRIYAGVFGTNPASQRILQKAGFKLEAHFKGTIFKNGEFIDEMVYAIRKPVLIN